VANVALTVLAHPDDAEFLCAGTLIRLVREHGWQAHIATMTPGDCGSAEHSAEQIAGIRRAEAKAAAAHIGGAYHCLEARDLLVFYDGSTLATVTDLLRRVRPQIVFTHSPDDYMLDHEMTSRLARAAAFNAPIPLFLASRGGPPPTDFVPHVYYCDPIEGKDLLGRPVRADIHVDIGGVIDEKSVMLACHASQRNWLLKHHGMDQYVTTMRDWATARGREIGVSHAEGFRQHRGHGYPQDDLLAETLGAILP
jgi:LmbE family N-acetylglucosaminyl deacetylase